jgi:hypothetical protein
LAFPTANSRRKPNFLDAQQTGTMHFLEQETLVSCLAYSSTLKMERIGLDDVDIFPYRNSNCDTSSVQPVASRYTDSTIPASEPSKSIICSQILE